MLSVGWKESTAPREREDTSSLPSPSSARKCQETSRAFSANRHAMPRSPLLDLLVGLSAAVLMGLLLRWLAPQAPTLPLASPHSQGDGQLTRWSRPSHGLRTWPGGFSLAAPVLNN